MLHLLRVLIISITWTLHVLKLHDSNVYVYAIFSEKESHQHFILSIQTKIARKHSLPHTWVALTDISGGCQSLNPPKSFIAFPRSMGYTLLNATQEEEDEKKQSTNHNVPLHVKRTTAVCTCSHNGRSALTFCVSPVQDSGP